MFLDGSCCLLRAVGGALALVAGAIVTDDGSALTSTGGSSVLYGAANDFTVRFSAPGVRFQLATIFVVSPQDVASPRTASTPTTAAPLI